MSYSHSQLAKPVEYLIFGKGLSIFCFLNFLLQISIFCILSDYAQMLLIREGLVILDDILVVESLQYSNFIIEYSLGVFRTSTTLDALIMSLFKGYFLIFELLPQGYALLIYPRGLYFDFLCFYALLFLLHVFRRRLRSSSRA
jgi:hypothetical protein